MTCGPRPGQGCCPSCEADSPRVRRPRSAQRRIHPRCGLLPCRVQPDAADELGNACLALNDLAGAPGVPAAFTGGRFETWLSSIAEPQPYEPEPSNLANQVLFVKFSDAIGQVLGSLVDSVLSVSPPSWMAKFVTATHVRQATVITFNYDTLVEYAVDYRDIYLPTLAEPVAWTEVTGDVPGWPAGTMRLGATPVDTFRLLKLHGSLNWFWIPGDASGLSVARRLLPGTFEASSPYTEQDRRRQLPARVPFVVPPSATKSSYYQNRLVREIWIQAGEALQAASQVSLIGYSLPMTDLTVSSMLDRTIGGTQVPGTSSTSTRTTSSGGSTASTSKRPRKPAASLRLRIM